MVDQTNEPFDPDDLRTLVQRISELEHRVAQLESPTATATTATPPLAATSPARAPAPPVPVATASVVQTVEPVEPVGAEAIDEQADDEPNSLRGAMLQRFLDRKTAIRTEQLATAEPAVAPPALGYAAKPQSPPPVREGALEQTIGLKLAGWFGGIIVVIGAVLGVKYAYDAGWIGGLPPELRLLLMALGGFALIAAGEWVYRKINIVSATGLFGAGIATLFVVSYTGYGFLNVYSRDVAFILMGITALIGAGVAVRGRLVSIGVLSHLGGHLAPLILGGDASRLLPLFSYLLMLQVVALSLAWWGGTSRWWVLRWLALATTSLWMTPIVLADRTPTLAFVFLLIYAGVFIGELIVSAVWPSRNAKLAAADLGQGVVFCIAATTGLASGTVGALDDASGFARAGWLLGYAAIYVALGFWLSRIASAHMLAMALRTLAAALAVLAVPIALAGSAVVLVWAGMAIAFGIVGARQNLKISRAASIVTWALAICYLASAYQNPDRAPAQGDIAFSAFTVDIPVYELLAIILTLAGLVIAWLLTLAAAKENADESSESDLVLTAQAVAGVASAVGVVATLAALPPAAATLVILAYAWMLALTDRHALRLWLIGHVVALVLLAAGKWAMVDLLAQRMGDGWSAGQLGYTPVLNPMTAIGSLIATSAVGIYFLRRKRIESLASALGATASSLSATLAFAGAFIVFVTFGMALEIDRIIEAARSPWPMSLSPEHVRQLWFTSVAAIGAMVFAGIVFWLERDPDGRRARLTLAGWLPLLLAGKFLVIDTIAMRLGTRGGSAVVVFNLEFLAAVLVLSALAMHAWPHFVNRVAETRRSKMADALVLAGLIVMLALGGYELWRLMDALAVSPLSRQVVLSVWWALFAVGAIGLGFRLRFAGLRYFGLALLAVTMVKVFVVDLQTVSRGWRTLSFIALGLLMLVTSVLYGKFSQKLLDRSSARNAVL